MKNFYTRISEFWRWFGENEDKLIDYADNMKNYQPQEIVELFSKGLNIAMDNYNFNLGGVREINLTPEGNIVMAFLTSYLANSIPDNFKDKWHFFAWKQPMPGMSLSIHGVEVTAENILVSVEEDNGKFGIKFYNAALNKLEESQAYQAFYILLDLTIGENIAMSFISWVDKGDKENDGMIKMSELKRYISENVENGIDDNYNPTTRYLTYNFTPSETDTTPRYDIVVGFTRLTALIDGYYRKENKIYSLLQNNGVKAAFLAITRTSDDHNVDLSIRNTIADRIEQEILGEADSGKELGLVVGQAIGIRNSYIDLILYNEEIFKEKISSILKDYELDVQYYDFVGNVE